MTSPASNFTIHRPASTNAVPIVIHVPHAADFVPEACRSDFVLSSTELIDEIAAMVDHFTDEVAREAIALGAHVFQNNVCRLVLDPERYLDDATEIAASWGMGAVYTHTQDGRRLRHEDWTAADRDRRISEFYHPYHHAMRDLVIELGARFRQPVHIIDLHSFPDTPLPYETDRGSRPLYCVGFEDRFVPTAWLSWWQQRAAPGPHSSDLGTSRDLVAFNRPFSGAFVPAGLPSAETEVRAMMVEINRMLLPQYPERTAIAPAAPELKVVQEFLEFACRSLRG